MELTISCHIQPTVLQASQTHPLASAAMPVTAMPSGVLFPCITCSNNRQLNFIRRSFIVSILAALSIGTGSYLYSASASSLSRKLRSLSLRAILRQDSKSVSYFRDAMPLRLLQLSTLTETRITYVQ
jgi:hypothetical protein